MLRLAFVRLKQIFCNLKFHKLAGNFLQPDFVKAGSLFCSAISAPSSFCSLLLEVFCNSLYETFRPLIIHMTHMETLAEICNILQVNMHYVNTFWNITHHKQILKMPFYLLGHWFLSKR